MWRMRLGLFGVILLGGMGALLLLPAIESSLASADALHQDSILVASAATGAGIFVSQLAVSAAVVEGMRPAQATPQAEATRIPAPTQVALAPTATDTPTQPPPTRTATAAPTATSTPVARATSALAPPSATATQTAPRPSLTATLVPATKAPTAAPQPTRTSPPPTPPASRPLSSPAPAQPPPPTATPRPVGGELRACGDITTPGTYRLAASLSPNSDCLKIRASNVVLDCQNHSLAGQGLQGTAISVKRYGVLGTTAPSNVEIRGCRISGFKNGIVVDAGSNIWIHHNDVSNNEDEVDERRFGIFLGMAESSGIRLNGVQGGRVENNTTNQNAIGIDIRGSSNIQVRGNTSSGNSAWGVNLVQTTASTVADNATADNIRHCSWGLGDVGPGCDAGGIILQNGSSGNTVTRNRVTGRNGNGIFIKAHGVPCGDNNTLSHNTIVGALYNGIELSFCKNNQIIGNEIANSLDGVWLGFSTGTTIRDNNIHDMRNHGIISYNSRQSDISNNTLTNDREGIFAYYEPVRANEFWWFNASTYRSEKNSINGNNIFKNGTSGIHLKHTIHSRITNNTLRFNNLNMWFEGESEGNVIENNIQQALAPPEIARWFGLGR